MAQQTQNSQDDLKVGELVEWLWPDIFKNDEILSWPPDVFAVVALLLQRSSAYLCVLRDWPPLIGGKGGADWPTCIRKIGQKWRTSKAVPPQIKRFWALLKANRSLPVASVGSNSKLCNALLQLSAAADEAAAGVEYLMKGIGLLYRGNRHLLNSDDEYGATLCRYTSFEVRVLPEISCLRAG